MCLSIALPIASFSVAHLEFGGWRYRGHKSHCYWCGYEPQPNGDDSARSFSSAFPLQRWALDTVHLTCHFSVLHSAICTEPIRTRRTFNFICSSTLQGFFSIVRHNAPRCDMQYYPHIFKVHCCAFSASLIVAGLLYSCKGTSAHVSSKPIKISVDYIEIPDPDLSLQAAKKKNAILNATRGKLYKCACSRRLCWHCMQSR